MKKIITRNVVNFKTEFTKFRLFRRMKIKCYGEFNLWLTSGHRFIKDLQLYVESDTRPVFR